MTTIVHKRGTGIPAADDLAVGEIAIDTSTGTAYTKTNAGEVVSVGGEVDLSTYVSTDTTINPNATMFNGGYQHFRWGSSGSQKYDIRIGQNGVTPSIGMESGFFMSGTHPNTKVDWTFEINEYGAVATKGMNITGNNTGMIAGFKSIQASDFLDADGNSIIGAGGGDPEWSKVIGDSTALGYGATAGTISSAVGGHAQAGDRAVALGYEAESEQWGIAIGFDATAQMEGIALGYNATAQMSGIALGKDATAFYNTFSIAESISRVDFSKATVQASDFLDADGNSIIGAGGGGDPEWANVDSGEESIAIGSPQIFETLADYSGIAIGFGMCTAKPDSVAIGRGAMAQIQGIAIGSDAMAGEKEFAISPSIDLVKFSGATVQAKDFLDANGNRATVSPSSIVEAFTTLQTAVADEDTLEGVKTALTNALGGLIEKFEGMSK